MAFCARAFKVLTCLATRLCQYHTLGMGGIVPVSGALDAEQRVLLSRSSERGGSRVSSRQVRNAERLARACAVANFGLRTQPGKTIAVDAHWQMRMFQPVELEPFDTQHDVNGCGFIRFAPLSTWHDVLAKEFTCSDSRHTDCLTRFPTLTLDRRAERW